MFSLSMNFDSSRIMSEIYGCEWLMRYRSDNNTLWYPFYRSFGVLVPVYYFLIIIFCSAVLLLNFISIFDPLLKL